MMTNTERRRRSDLAQAIESEAPSLDGFHLATSPVQDHWNLLFPEEQAQAATIAERRKREFSTGRYLARQAMVALGLSPSPVLRGKNREPIWPEGVQGSITHAGDWVVACVSRAAVVRSVGVDLEQADRVQARLYGKLFTENELARIRAGEPRLAAVMFSAKEAGYKATHPLGGRYIGFQEAEVDVDWNERRFRLRYLGRHIENSVMDTAEGYFLFCGPYVLSLVIIPIDC